jgi:hypothetical protein
MFDRQGRLAWLLFAFALSPLMSAAGDPPAGAHTDQKAQKDQNASAAKAADAPSDEADDELLEFLGSVDADDRELIDYAARTKAPAPDKAKSTPTAANAENSASGATHKTVTRNE